MPKTDARYGACDEEKAVPHFRPPPGPRRWTTSLPSPVDFYALLTTDGEESALILEGLDDVELQDATAIELQQLKHYLSTKRQAVLSNRSTD